MTSVARTPATPAPADAGKLQAAEAEAEAVHSHAFVRGPIDFIIVLLIAATVFKGFVAEGYFVPSGSMAPGLLGFHYRATCPDCGYEFSVGREEGSWPPSSVPCPMCRESDVPIKSATFEAGDRLLVFKWVYQFQRPKRWETVVFRNPNDADQAYVKRVVGLPGESVAVDDGDVFINGKISRKSYDQLARICLPVYDQSIVGQNPPAAADRFESLTVPSRWSMDGMRLIVDSSTSRTPHELAYCHLNDRGRGAATEDDNGYNAWHVGRIGSVVKDLRILFDAYHEGGSGYIGARYQASAGRKFELRVFPETGRILLLKDGKPWKEARGPAWNRDSRRIVLAVWDQRLSVRIGNEIPFGETDLESKNDRISTDLSQNQPFILTSRDAKFVLDRLRIDRDVHYRPAPHHGFGGGQTEPYRLTDKEYFVLGDNSAVSNDSRSWDVPAVPEYLLIGKPLFVHLPTRTWSTGLFGRQWRLAIPDFQRIRRVY